MVHDGCFRCGQLACICAPVPGIFVPTTTNPEQWRGLPMTPLVYSQGELAILAELASLRALLLDHIANQHKPVDPPREDEEP